MTLDSLLSKIDRFLWSSPLLILILGTGILLTVRTRAVQLKHLGKALKFALESKSGAKGEVSSFGALCTALSATIGTGNIIGVATAVAGGGPGALLWMLVAAFFGMATKYAEGLLAIKYRTVDKNGHTLGGPFYYIERGLTEVCGWKKSRLLGKLFALFGLLAGVLGIGTVTQINGITSATDRLFGSKAATACGWAVTLFAALVILGGVKRIAKVSEIVVPFMAGAYLLFAVTILCLNANKIPEAVHLMLIGAFNVKALGGAMVGITLKEVVQMGIARGVFSNEAGLGSAPIAAAAAQTDSCVQQGLVTMVGTFIDTVIICTMTGLTIIITGAWTQPLEGFDITAFAWQSGLPFGKTASVTVLSLCLIFFAFTTILGWNYYAERCFEYLMGNKKGLLWFRIIYIAAVAVGPYLTVSAVWTAANIFNGLMALPNLIALVLLSGVVERETKKYFSKQPKITEIT